MSKKSNTTTIFCKKCYKDAVYFTKENNIHVTIRCCACNSFVKFASKEEAEGKFIVGKNNFKLF